MIVHGGVRLQSDIFIWRWPWEHCQPTARGKHIYECVNSTDLWWQACREQRPPWACPVCGRWKAGEPVRARFEDSPVSWFCKADAPPYTPHLREAEEGGCEWRRGQRWRSRIFKECIRAAFSLGVSGTKKKKDEAVKARAVRAFRLTTLHFNVTCYFLQRERAYRCFSFGISPCIISNSWHVVVPMREVLLLLVSFKRRQINGMRISIFLRFLGTLPFYSRAHVHCGC